MVPARGRRVVHRRRRWLFSDPVIFTVRFHVDMHSAGGRTVFSVVGIPGFPHVCVIGRARLALVLDLINCRDEFIVTLPRLRFLAAFVGGFLDIRLPTME